MMLNLSKLQFFCHIIWIQCNNMNKDINVLMLRITDVTMKLDFPSFHCIGLYSKLHSNCKAFLNLQIFCKPEMDDDLRGSKILKSK
jgi:hypothetical protein